jgi:hypothetical protein
LKFTVPALSMSCEHTRTGLTSSEGLPATRSAHPLLHGRQTESVFVQTSWLKDADATGRLASGFTEHHTFDLFV